MDEDKNAEPTNGSTPPESVVRTIEVGVCPKCGYELKGQPLPGTCPECGHHYTDQSQLPSRPKPSAFRICLLYGWPLLAIVGSYGVIVIPSNDPYAGIAWMLFCLVIFVASAINGGIITVLLLKRYLPRDRSHLDGLHKRMRFVGGSVVLMFYLMVVLPVVIGGGCTFLVFAGA